MYTDTVPGAGAAKASGRYHFFRNTGVLQAGNPLIIMFHALRIHRMLMAWCGQNSLHLKQEQQRWLLYGYTRPSFFTNTPIEHMSMQTRLCLQR